MLLNLVRGDVRLVYEHDISFISTIIDFSRIQLSVRFELKAVLDLPWLKEQSDRRSEDFRCSGERLLHGAVL